MKGVFLLTSYEKLVKYLVENIQVALAPLKDVTKNQEILIVQNKQIIGLLENIRANGVSTETNETESSAPDEAEIEE
ncbi:MAG TPA: hypothetical protein VGL27_17460 [Negativicutes bacterium]|jgi:NH3-dependent NAD+ synthetase